MNGIVQSQHQGRKNHNDRVRQIVACKKCERVLAKVDIDGVLHIKPTRGPEVIVSKEARVMFICESTSYFAVKDENDPRIKLSKFPPKKESNGKISIWIECGSKTIIQNGILSND